jgi:hypothetical protein
VRTPADLQAVILGRLRIRVIQDGKRKGGRIPPAELASMLRTELFLLEFRPLDRVVSRPVYMPDWTEARPGYNDGGRTQRDFLAGELAPRSPTAQRRRIGSWTPWRSPHPPTGPTRWPWP